MQHNGSVPATSNANPNKFSGTYSQVHMIASLVGNLLSVGRKTVATSKINKNQSLVEEWSRKFWPIVIPGNA